MPPRTTLSNLSTPPVTGEDFLEEYATRLKSLFDAAAFPLTAVAGTGNAVTASLDPPLDPGGLVNGMKFTITWGAANTGAVTLAINGGTAVPVVDADNVALGASALASGRRSLIEFIGGAFRILSSAGGGAAGGGPTYQAFTASGTWTKPTGYDPDTVVMIEVWGGGGAGGAAFDAAGGSGGGYNVRLMRIADMPSSVTVTIGAGGTAPGGAGGNTTFGSLVTGWGAGGGGSVGSGNAGRAGRGGELSAGTSASGATSGADGAIGGTTHTGGLGGQGLSGFNGGGSVFGGGGGGGWRGASSSAGASGESVRGGAGGAGSSTAGSAGQAPGGGGGAGGTSGGNGARGECRVTIFG